MIISRTRVYGVPLLSVRVLHIVSIDYLLADRQAGLSLAWEGGWALSTGHGTVWCLVPPGVSRVALQASIIVLAAWMILTGLTGGGWLVGLDKLVKPPDLTRRTDYRM